MAKATVKSFKGQLSKKFELGENMTAGDSFFVYNDTGTPKIAKCFSRTDDKSSFGRGYYSSCCMISSNTFVVVYRDINSSNHGRAVIGRIEANKTITWGTPLTFLSLTAYYLDVCSYTSDAFCVTYKGTGNRVCLMAGTVDGSLNITYGTEVAGVSIGSCYYNQIISPSEGTICAVYRDGGHSNYTDARAVTITGNTIGSLSAVTTLETISASYHGLCSPDTDKIAVAYYASSKGYAVAATLTGTTINAPGARSEFNATGTYTVYSASPDNNKFCVIFRSSGDGYKPHARCVSLAGTTFGTWGDDVKLADISSYYMSIGVMEANEVVFMYTVDSSPYQGYICKASISGNEINLENSECFHNDRVYYVDCAGIGPDEYLLVWYDVGALVSYGLVVEGNLNTIPKCLGILEETGVAGERKKCNLLNSITKSLSGMTSGTVQYIQCNGNISDSVSTYPIAIAIDTDEAFISKTILG